MTIGHPDRVSVIDIGTNSILFLIASKADGPSILAQETKTVRLGSDLQSSGMIPAEAVAKAVNVVNAFKEKSVQHDAECIAVATHVLRSAVNAEEVRQALADETGLDIRILSEAEEAELSYHGAVAGRRLTGSILVADIGGGSTEFALGHAGSGGIESMSLPLGAVTLSRRHLHDDPPSVKEWQELTNDVQNSLKTVPALADRWATTLIGVGGTVTSLAAIELGQGAYDASMIDGLRLSGAAVADIIRSLRAMTLDRRKKIMAFDPERADIILAGAAILIGVMDEGGFSEILVSDRGLRYGLALQSLGIQNTTL